MHVTQPTFGQTVQNYTEFGPIGFAKPQRRKEEQDNENVQQHAIVTDAFTKETQP
jgi:hypothetical protein